MMVQTGSIIYRNFDNPILYDPAKIENGDNSLKIITAFTDTERIATHLITLTDGFKEHRYVNDISVEIILGMTKSSLSQKKHDDICHLMRQLSSSKSHYPKVSCRYISTGQEVHSKVYIWSKEDIPDLAFCGSLNYTNNAFYKRRESVCACNPIEALNYYNILYPDSLDCQDPAVIDKIKNIANNTDIGNPEDDVDGLGDYATYDNRTPEDTIEISLLTAAGETGYGSGVNWGIRPNGTRRNPNQAYIPYNVKDRKKGFFPDRENPEDKSCPIFRVITKSGGSFHMRMAQANNKALQSAESNAILGEWIRKELGVPSGTYITKRMLENHGKTSITFRKYDDGTYLLDF